MIDVHCHLLPSFDDGPSDVATSVALARQACEDGVTHVVITPHIHQGRWEHDAVAIEVAVGNFKAILEKEGVALAVGVGAEVRIGFEVLNMVQSSLVPFLGKWEGRDVMLLEMPHSHIPPGSEKIVQWLLDRGVHPMIAHPERNKDIIRKLDKISPLVEAGCLFQLTAGSVAGKFGDAARGRALELLEMGVVTVLATDAHHPDRRPAVLSEGAAEVEKLFGAQLSRQLVSDNPWRIASCQFEG